MKSLIIVLFLLIPLLSKSQTTQNNTSNNKNIHSSLNVTNGDISSEAGSVSYSIGQVYYSSHNSEKNYVTEGIQQPLTISITSIDIKEEDSFKVAAYPNPVSNYFTIETSRAPP
jgi:hypothetical protein